MQRATFGEIFFRCLRSKCPVCGRGKLFEKITNLSQMRDLFLPLTSCTVCFFRFGRQPGYYFGVVTPILPLLSLAVGLVFAGTAHFGFHRELESVLTWGGVGLGIGILLFFRTSIAIYVALDHAIDPPERDEFHEVNKNES